MSLKNLTILKKQLESEQKYVPINNFTYQKLLNAPEAKPLSEYISQENTEEFVNECEALIEIIIRELVERGFPFEKIILSSNIGFLCRASFIETIKSLYDCNKIDDNSYSKIAERLEMQASSIYVPLSFSLNTFLTGTANGCMSLADQALYFGGIDKPTVTGIVNLETFLSKMKSHGYDIQLLNYGQCHSISDYIQVVKKNGFETHMDIVADFSRDLQEENIEQEENSVRRVKRTVNYIDL